MRLECNQKWQNQCSDDNMLKKQLDDRTSRHEIERCHGYLVHSLEASK